MEVWSDAGERGDINNSPLLRSISDESSPGREYKAVFPNLPVCKFHLLNSGVTQTHVGLLLDYEWPQLSRRRSPRGNLR